MHCRRALAAAVILAVAAMPSDASARDRPPVQDLTYAYNSSGQALFRRFSAAPGNIVLSPYSIGSAMAMALAGARGDTEREMAKVLQHALKRAQIDDANAAALAVLNGYDKSGVAPSCPPGMTLNGARCEAKPDAQGVCNFPAGRVAELCVAEPRHTPSAKLVVANALMMAGANVSPDYAALLKDKYAAELFHRASLDTVNGWVKNKTEGKIERILDKMSDVVLVNAVYFKSRWALVFNKSATIDEFFSLSRTRQELVPMMQQRSFHPVVQRAGYRAIRLPYAVRSIGMVIVLPDEVDGLGAVAARLDMAEFSQLLAVLRAPALRPVALSLPRFKAEFSAELTGLFQDAGMRLAFDPRRADFSFLTGVPPAKAPTAIEQIAHRAVIEVAEEATEAAAATAVAVITSAAPKPVEPIRFRIDRPFLYYIVDDTTGSVLFQGRIVDPR